jgi:hypothetical protein
MVDAFQVCQVVRRRFEIEMAGGDFGKVALGAGQQVIAVKIEAIAQDARTRIAVRVLAGAVLVQAQACLR